MNASRGTASMPRRAGVVSRRRTSPRGSTTPSRTEEGNRVSRDERAGLVLIAYDGSRPSQIAIEQAARLFPGATALIVTSWRSVSAAAGAARAALPQAMIDDAVRSLDAAAEAEATRLSGEGAAQARQEGMRASGVAVRADPSIWASIVATAHEHDARAVVVGSRGCSGLRSALLGSVSNALVHRCSRPVVVVHPPEDAALET
jgi:nucleotide-binding universal stress UspA family protein